MSTQAEVDLSYSVDNEFFQLWLDDEMNYTCALFRDTEHWSDSLEDAQQRKLECLSRLARIGPATESVLDIGCGWGANLAFQAHVNGVRVVHGITLSRAQHEYCTMRALPNVSVQLCDYRDYVPRQRFRAAMCICMMEHIATPSEARAGLHIARYRDFFRRLHAWTLPGAHVALQAITTNVVPRDRADLDDMRHANSVIFPGGRCPRVEDIVVSVHPYFEVIEMHARRLHYRRTAECWLERLRRNEATVERRWGRALFDHYERYLAFCVRAFDQHFQSLHQFSLRRRNGHHDKD